MRTTSSTSKSKARSTRTVRTTKAAAHRGQVSLSVEGGPHAGVRKTEIERRIEAMIEELQLQDKDISFVLTDDKRIHQLNKIYRHIDRPTDVLAFAMQEGEFAELAGPVLGDVIVSVETARKQATERSVPLVAELTMLLAHGLLHLLGWDHETPAKDRRMRAETERLCRAAAPSEPAKPVRPASAAKTRSKAGAKRSVSQKVSAGRTSSRGEKVQAARRVKGRRSRSG